MFLLNSVFIDSCVLCPDSDFRHCVSSYSPLFFLFSIWHHTQPQKKNAFFFAMRTFKIHSPSNSQRKQNTALLTTAACHTFCPMAYLLYNQKIPRAGGQERRLRFAGPAMRRCPRPRSEKPQRWWALEQL